jgi:hypothetical protein
MPYNGDPAIVDIVLSDFREQVRSFYGSCAQDPFGGGRALTPQHESSLEDFRGLTNRLDRANIEFNYVINNTNMLNRGFLPDYRRYYLRYLRDLESVGIRAVTLSTIHFIELTKAHLPDLKVSASVNLKTRTPAEVQFLVGIGCDEITLHYDILKDAPALTSIRASTGVDLRLIVNDVYVMGCPWQKGHTRMQGAHSRAKGFATPYFSYYRNKCVNLRHYRPEEIFKAMWIPPDQLWRYERIGYFHFKLLDRLASTTWNIRVLNAYVTQGGCENLEMLLGTYGCAPSASIAGLSRVDGPYPSEKLEVVPSIRSDTVLYDHVFAYFLESKSPPGMRQLPILRFPSALKYCLS